MGTTPPSNQDSTIGAQVAKSHRAEAIKLLEARLEAHPTDSDARAFYGTVLSWDRRYTEARKQLEIVLAELPNHEDALSALINVELWSDHPEEAERLARVGLERDPKNLDLLVARAKALAAMKKARDASNLAKAVLKVDPANPAAKELHDDLADSLRTWETTMTHTSDWFSQGNPWREDQLAISDETRSGLVLARFSEANRHKLESRQAELEYYPHFRPGTYAYLEGGYSPDARLYPRYRGAADIYQKLGYGFEVTTGYRRLAFGSGVNIYTAALNKYYGQWMFTGRTYVTPDSLGTEKSFQFSVRRYLSERRNYWTIRGGWGSVPNEISNITDIGILSSETVFAEFSHILSHRLILMMQTGVSKQDRVNIAGLYDITASINLYIRL